MPAHPPLEGVTLHPGGIESPAEKNPARGRVFAPEWSFTRDRLTGASVTRFTASAGTDQHPYFTSPASTSAGKLVILSDRTGHPNLFSVDLSSGHLLQLTDNRLGTLRQYVFPWGNRVGLGKSSVSVCAATGDVFFLQGRSVRKVNAAGGPELILATLPRGVVSAFTHVSDDGSLLCVPLIPEEAFALAGEAVGGESQAGFAGIEARVRELGLESLLWVLATDGRSQSVVARQAGAWVTHAQFRPGRTDQILFNNEATGDRAGAQRMWLADRSTGAIRRIRPEPADRPMWVCHEVWTHDGREILYHGARPDPATGVRSHFWGFADPDTGAFREHFLRPEHDRVAGYGHLGVHASTDHAYTDGLIDPAMIHEICVGSDGFTDVRPLCRHGSLWTAQDDHPHPVLSSDGRMLFFTSSRDGTTNVYGLRL